MNASVCHSAERGRCAASLQRGVGLIEVLIAVLILSIGLLGLANLQAFSLRSSQSSHERAMAVVHTHSIADAMRAERARAMSGEFDLAADAEPAEAAGFVNESLRQWRAQITAALGDDATGSVDCDGALCTITIQWNETRAGGAAEYEVTTEVQI